MTLFLGIVEFMSLGPVVAKQVCENLAIVIDAARSNTLGHLLRYCHLGALIFVTNNSSQRSMFRTNLDVIHSVNIQLRLSTVTNSTMASEE